MLVKPISEPPESSGPDTAQEWARAGLQPTEAAAAESMGFRPADVIGLRRSTTTELEWPAIERRLKAAVESIRTRAKVGPFDTWIRNGGSMADAVAWMNADFTLSAANQWCRRGFTTPEQAAPWRTHGFDSEPAAEWRDGGIDDPRVARKLISHGVQGPDIAKLVKRGLTSDEAREWLSAEFRVEQIPGWYDIGLSPDEVTALREARLIGDVRVGELLARGVPLEAIGNLAALTGRTWVELRRATDVDEIVRTLATSGAL